MNNKVEMILNRVLRVGIFVFMGFRDIIILLEIYGVCIVSVDFCMM